MPAEPPSLPQRSTACRMPPPLIPLLLLFANVAPLYNIRCSTTLATMLVQQA